MDSLEEDRISLSSLLLHVNDDEEETTIACTSRSTSTLSQLSLASTASTITADTSDLCFSPSIDVSMNLIIEVFCTFNGWLVRIDYPSIEQGWTYRPELGGHSQHRWDYGNVMMLMARHSTCGRAVFPRNLCRNCVMKSVWRRECIEPCNTFYLLAINAVQTCIDALRPLIHEAVKASEVQSAAYFANAPKANLSRKRACDSNAKLERVLKCEMALRLSLMHGRSKLFDGQRSFLTELNEELQRKDSGEELLEKDLPPLLPVLHETLPTQAMLSTCVVPSPQRVVVTNVSPIRSTPPTTLSPTGVIVAQPVRARLPLITTTDPIIAYEELMGLLPIKVNNTTVLVKHNDLLLFVAAHPNMKAPHSMIGVSENLSTILEAFGVFQDSQLLVKTTLFDWTGDIVAKSAASGSIAISVGFYVPPSVGVYEDIYRMSSFPRVLMQGTHRIESDYGAACAQAALNTKPIVIAYHGGASLMVPGANILPLGIVHT